MDSPQWALEFRDFLNGSPLIGEGLPRGSSFVIHGSSFFDSCPSTVSTLLLNPLDTLETCNAILSEVCHRPGMKLRLSSMPPVLELIRSTVPRSSEAGYFLSFLGTVVKTGSVKLMEWMRDFTCKKCGSVESLKAEFEMYQAFNPPRNCPACHAGPNPWRPHLKESGKLQSDRCKDYQEIKVQEQIQNLGLGTVPRSVWVALEDDIVDSCKPGDDVLVIGTVCRRWKALGKALEDRTEIELVIRANYIQVQNDEKSKFHLSHESVEGFQRFWKKYEGRRLIGRNIILSSFCPQVYGLFIVKLATAVVLAGGVERVDETGTRVRGEPHMLLVGDPGTGKSQILKYASRLSQRSVMTTGMGSTSAGLTVSAVKASGSWNLEAGALVLADGGVCCIDEFNGIRESDRTCIHEAMEQQSLSIAKAGLVCKLQTRCSVLAAANPKGSYNPDEPLSVNIAVASPLLSRFDLVLILMDLKNEAWDEMVASYLLNGMKPFHESGNTAWSLDTLRSYFSYVKSLQPEMTTEVSQIISRYYQRQRSNEFADMARTTVRLLQSIVRLSQGHARLLHHSRVEILDVVNAILLIEASGAIPSSSSLIVNNSTNSLQSTFSANPLADYYEQAKSVLLGLNLQDLWQNEEERLKKLAEGDFPPGMDDDIPDPPPQEAKKDANPLVLTQVMSKLKNKFAFVETVLPRKRKRKAKSVKRVDLEEEDDDSTEEDEPYKPKSSTQIPSQDIRLSSDDSDFESHRPPKKCLKDIENPSATSLNKALSGKLRSKINAESNKTPEHNDYQIDGNKSTPKDNLRENKQKPHQLTGTSTSFASKLIDKSPQKISEPCNSSFSDLDLSLNDTPRKKPSKENTQPSVSKKCSSQSDDSLDRIFSAACASDESKNSDLELSLNHSPQFQKIASSHKDESSRIKPSKALRSGVSSSLQNSSPDKKIVLSNRTLNRFKEFTAPSSSPECSQPKVTLSDIFSQSHDDDLDLDI